MLGRGRKRSENDAPDKTPWTARFREPVSDRTVVLSLIGLFALSSLFRIGLAMGVHAPTVFSDELGYTKLAQSIGKTGDLALFNERGLSYSPVYSLVLSPIYALGASAPTAYTLIKIVNAVLMSLAIFPTYKIARFALPRGLSLVVAGLSTLAPLMLYPSFTMSESLSYPVCLVAIWVMLATVRSPGPRMDAVLLASMLLASAVRIQLIVLVPAAVTAVLLAAILESEGLRGLARSIARSIGQHWLLAGVLSAAFLAAAAWSVTGHDALAAFGRYANVGRRGFPDVGRLLDVFMQHLAGLDLAVGVIPFVGSLVAAFAFLRSGRRLEHVAFAAVAVAVTAWFLLEVAIDAALFDVEGGDVPRIHERFLIYVVPFFLVGLLAAFRASETKAPALVYLVAAGLAALLPVFIPFHTVINNTIAIDSPGLHPFARTVEGRLAAVSHATLLAVFLAATLGLLYVYVRSRLRAVVILVLLPFVLVTGEGSSRIASSSRFTRSLLPAHVDWVDRVKPTGDVVLITGRRPTTPELETAYFNLSITRMYFICRYAVGPEFGERQATIGRSGRLRGPTGFLKARFVVAPASLRIRGEVLALNRPGHEVLVAPENGQVRIPAARRRPVLKSCRRPGSGRR